MAAINDPAAPVPKRSRRGLAIIGTIALLGALGFFALGVWQLERLAWKNGLVAAVEARSTAAPTDPSSDGTWQSFDPDRDEYRHVSVTGTFDPDVETLTQAVTAYGGGFWVMTPLHLANGRSILVNRGFIPPENREKSSRQTTLAGPLTVTGLLRQTEPDGGFLRSNDPANNRWFSRDVTAIAKAEGLTDPAPFFIDQERVGTGYPIGGLTVLSFPNNHLIYALTWFALSLMLLAAFAYTLWDRKRPT